MAGTHGTNAALILTSSGGPVFPVPFVDASPAPQIYQAWSPWHPGDPWDYPPSVNAEYQSNYTAIQGTGNITLEKQYLNSIQALQAQYLPEIVLDYPGDVWAYSTQRWVNWTQYPTGWADFAGAFDWAQFANLVQAGSNTSSTSTSLVTGVTSTTASPVSLDDSIIGKQFIISCDSIATSSSTSSSGGSILYVGVAVVVIVIVIAGVALAMRRRRPAAAPPP